MTMPTSWSRSLKLLSLCLALMVSLSACKKNKLDEESVRKFIDDGLQAVVRGDAKLLCDQLAESAQITLIRIRFSGSDKKTFAKDDYCVHLTEGLQSMRDARVSYSVNLDVRQVLIAADGKSADVETETIEEISVQGRQMGMRTQGKSHVEMIKGKLFYTEIVSRVME